MTGLLAQGIADSVTCRLPVVFGFCTEDLLPELIGAAILGLVGLLFLRPAAAYLKRRLGVIDKPRPEFTDELRLGLLSEAKRRSWGQLDRLIRLPSGFRDLKLEPRVGLVDGPRSNPEVIDLRTDQPKIVKVFDEAERKLLIVGEPGSGKTVLLYKIAEHLAKQHLKDPSCPLPVVFNLSAWEQGATVEGWVTSQLCDRVAGFALPDPMLAGEIVATGRVAFLFDGLDEVPEAHRRDCLKELNRFLPGVLGEVPVVVSCRIREFRSLIDVESPLGCSTPEKRCHSVLTM